MGLSAGTLRRVLPLLAALLVLATLVAPGAVASPVGDQAGSLRQGFDLLMDRFVHPLPSDVLLVAAWRTTLAEADRHGLAWPTRSAPRFTGERESDWRAFQSLWMELASEAAGRVDSAVLAGAALRGMADAADEGHTVYLDPERYAEHRAWASGQVRYAGIGARIAGPEPTIIEVFEGSPADTAGLRPGDLITHVDAETILGRPLAEVVSQVRGPPGTSLALTVVRASEPEPLVVRVVRMEIELRMLERRMLPDQVGYVRVRGFPEPAVADRFRQSVAELKEQGAEALVLDLRGNSGGRLDVGNRVLRALAQDGPLYQQVTRDGNTETAYARPSEEPLELPLAVLVDGGTASMGEIVASVIQEHGLGTVVGQTTAGNVAAAQVYPLGDGSALQVTIMEIHTGHGQPLNGVGVTPDLLVENSAADLAHGRDAQLLAALTVLALERQPAHVDRAWTTCPRLPCAA